MNANFKELETTAADHEKRLEELETKLLSVFHTLKKTDKRHPERFNPIKKFFMDRCVFFTGARITPPDLYNHYRTWSSDHGIKILGKQHFFYAFHRIYPRIFKKRYGTRDFFSGIEIDRPTSPQ